MSSGLDLSESIVEAFEGRQYITVREAANALRMSTKTLLRHVAAGNIVGRQIGLGRKRPRRVFALSDVARAKFLSLAPQAKPARPIALTNPRAPSSAPGSQF